MYENYTEEDELLQSEPLYNINQFTGECPYCKHQLFWSSDFDGDEISDDLANKIISYWSCSNCENIFSFIIED